MKLCRFGLDYIGCVIMVEVLEDANHGHEKEHAQHQSVSARAEPVFRMLVPLNARCSNSAEYTKTRDYKN